MKTDGPVQLPLNADRPPLRVDDGGAVRVGTSRVGLEVIVDQYENGMSPEELVRAYDTLQLSDVYAVVAWYLKYGDEVRTWLTAREEAANALRAKIESEHPPLAGAELMARRAVTESAHVASGQ